MPVVKHNMWPFMYGTTSFHSIRHICCGSAKNNGSQHTVCTVQLTFSSGNSNNSEIDLFIIDFNSAMCEVISLGENWLAWSAVEILYGLYEK